MAADNFDYCEEMLEPDSSRQPILGFDDICVDVQTKRILWNVSGAVEKGEILAIMGPSGECPLIDQNLL